MTSQIIQKNFVLIVFLLFIATSCKKDPIKPIGPNPQTGDYSAYIANKWFDLERDMVWKTKGFTPPVVARAFGYTSLALYESVKGGMPGYKSLADQLDSHPNLPLLNTQLEYYWPASANAAFAESMRGLFKSAVDVKLNRIDSLENALNLEFRNLVNPVVLAQSNSYGKSVGSAIYEWSRTDGGDTGYLSNFPTSYTPPVGDAMWVQTDANLALQPFWGNNRPFIKASITGTTLNPPKAFSTDPSSEFYKQALEVYNMVNNATPEQIIIANFWSCDPGTSSTPAGHSFSIMTQVLKNKNANLALAAEAYAKLGVALNDAFICCWKEKYQYSLIRPVTYINKYIDPSGTWKTILVTPPFPEYASGHSVESSVSATIMASMFGENTSFDDHTNDIKGMAARHFDKFSDFAKEAAISRMYGGIHYRDGMEEGLKEGKRIGGIYNMIKLH